MTTEPLTHAHMEALSKQGVPQAADVLKREGYLEALLANGPGVAGIVPEGVVAAMGMVEQNPGNFRCWAIMDLRLMRRHFIVACKEMRRFLAAQKVRRIETIVQRGNIPAMRWVENILGFTLVGPMRQFNEYGDAWLYERING